MEQNICDRYIGLSNYRHFTLWQRFRLFFMKAKTTYDRDINTGEPEIFIKYKSLKVNGDSHGICIVDIGEMIE